MSDTNTDDHYKKKHHHHHHHRNRHHKSKHKESGVQSQIDASLVPEATPIVSVAERVQSIESGGGRDVGNIEEPKFTSSATPLTLDENNILADPAVSFSDNSRSFKIKSSTDGPFQPTSPLPKPPQNEVNNIDGDNERDALNFVKHPIRETSKVATKIVSKLGEMQTEMTFQSISNKGTWSDAHISDNINEGKDSNQSPSKSSSSISMSSLVGYLLLAVCTIIKEVSVLFLGKSTVTFLEENMAPPPTVDAGYTYISILYLAWHFWLRYIFFPYFILMIYVDVAFGWVG